jgi:hypothetical protein
MCKICRNEPLEGLKELYCSYCPLVTEIPNIKGLKVLDCYGCPLLTEIPNIKGLKELDCSDCPLLTKIPNIKELEYIDCFECPLLKKLPMFKSLECFNSIPFTKDLLVSRYILTCFLYKFKIPNKSKQIFKVKLEKYAEHMSSDYVNPNSIFMKYYINNSFSNDFEEKLKIGYLSKDNKELKLLTFK